MEINAAEIVNDGDPAIMGEEEAGPSSKDMMLEHEYTFWVFIKSSNRAADDWKPKKIATMKSMQEFWSVYQHLKRPN